MHPVYNRHMFVQAFAMVVVEPVVGASTIAVAAVEVEELAVPEELAEAEAPVAEVEARIALEAVGAVASIAGGTRVVGLWCDIAEVIDESAGIVEDLVRELAGSADRVLHYCNRKLHLGLQMVS